MDRLDERSKAFNTGEHMEINPVNSNCVSHLSTKPPKF